MTARLVICGASGVDEKRAEWVPLDPGDEPSDGARLAVVGGAEGVTVLLVELEGRLARLCLEGPVLCFS